MYILNIGVTRVNKVRCNSREPNIKITAALWKPV